MTVEELINELQQAIYYDRVNPAMSVLVEFDHGDLREVKDQIVIDRVDRNNNILVNDIDESMPEDSFEVVVIRV